MKPKFPERYIKTGERILHSGQTTDIFYDVEELMKDGFYFDLLLGYISFSGHYIGVETGGRIMVEAAHGESPWSQFSYVTKGGKLEGNAPSGEWVLIDDVVTTGRSLLEAISIVGIQPERIIVAVDRRDRNENPVVNSIFQI